VTTRCAASWYELNLSAPDNHVSACCFYAGEKDEWSDAPKSLDHYWNSPAMRAVRRLQVNPSPPANHGCSTCHLWQNTAPGYEFYDFRPEQPPAGLSKRQADNWLLAKSEYLAGTEVAAARPMRIYANFGFACNISCNMCHQVPRRIDNRRQISAEQLLQWAPDLEQAIEVIVIGGEPFVLSEAVKFIRRFIADTRFEEVQLAIATNGTVLHKHWETLRRKRKLRLAISLDGVGEAFEKVRLGAEWRTVEANILKVIETRAADRPDWKISTSANIQKQVLPNLADFARWHVRYGLTTYFYDFITAAGVEDVYHRENFLQNTQLLDDMPGWQDHFDEAIAVYAAAGQTSEVDALGHFKARVKEAAEKAAAATRRTRYLRARNDWVRHSQASGGPMPQPGASLLEAHGAPGRGAPPLGERQGMRAFLATRLGDHLATPFVGVAPPPAGGSVRVRLHWPRH
jgi:organic radical activating enzyme